MIKIENLVLDTADMNDRGNLCIKDKNNIEYEIRGNDLYLVDTDDKPVCTLAETDRFDIEVEIMRKLLF